MTETSAHHIDIADAVLQADDDGPRRSVVGDQFGHVGGCAALDGHQNNVGPGKRDRVGGQGTRRSLDPVAPSRSEMRNP